MDTTPTPNAQIQEDGAIVFNRRLKNLADVQRQLANLQVILETLQKDNQQ